MALLNSIPAGMLILKLTLIMSIVLQLATALLALRLIKIAGARAAWVLIALALGAMALRRGITLAGFGWEELDGQSLPDLVAELVALGTSALLLAGMALIGPHVAAMRRSEREIRNSREVLKATLAACPVGLCLVRRGQLDWANRSMLAMFGFRLEQWTGQPAQILFGSQERYEEVNHQVSQGLVSQGRAAIQCQLVTRQGQPFEAQVQAQPLDAKSSPRGSSSR